MAADPHRRREPPFDGGAQPVPDRPPDEPGRLRGPALVIVLLLGLLIVAMPVAWGLGRFAVVGGMLGTAGLIAYWVVWALCLLVFAWAAWALWRRAG